jgi:hypothetical protein
MLVQNYQHLFPIGGSTNLLSTILSFCALFYSYVVLFGEIEKRQQACVGQIHRAAPDRNRQGREIGRKHVRIPTQTD